MPDTPRQDFRERHEGIVSGVCCGADRGMNIIETKMERNYYLTNEAIKAKVKIDNSRSNAPCKEFIAKVVQTLNLRGHGDKTLKIET